MYKYVLLSLAVYILLAILFEACYKYFLHKKGIEFRTNLSIFLNFLFIIVPHYIVHFLIGCLILLFVPFNTISFISRYFSESKIENKLSSISKRIKEELEKKIKSYKKQKEKVNIMKINWRFSIVIYLVFCKKKVDLLTRILVIMQYIF